MASFKYFANGSLVSFSFVPLATAQSAAARVAKAAGKRRGAQGAAAPVADVGQALHRQKRLATRFHELSEGSTLASAGAKSGGITVATETIAVDGARAAEVKWLRGKLGFEIVREGRQGKVLLRAPEGGAPGVAAAFSGAAALYRRGKVGAAHPNFIRVFRHMPRAGAAPGLQWNLANPGKPQGRVGADVHARAAWTITQGLKDIRVAVLDEGVDSLHPELKSAVVAELDAVDGNADARPDGDDAHGTACAGIIGSRSATFPGLAPGVSLVGVRIAKGDGNDGWVFDDFDTADAIDWAWDEGKADVLSNSWGGGPPADVITRAFDRARTRGRGGKGSVVVVAAGNDAGPVSYPAVLPFVLAVGASNQWDEQKTPISRDGEPWGSNFGPQLDLLAPGVKIVTTDISGPRGYAAGDFVGTFNGTSSATPHVAAAAALILSVRPDLSESRVRELVKVTADRLAKKGVRDDRTGHGRLNTYEALWLSRR